MIPDSNEKTTSPGPLVDVPRIGWLLWLVLFCFLIPPAVVALIGSRLGGIPHQNLYVILLGLPIPLGVLSLPRRYVLDEEEFRIEGLFYKVRVPRAQIRGLTRVTAAVALLHPASMFCSDPSAAYRLERRGRRGLIVSFKDPRPFLDALTPQKDPPSAPPAETH
ncbi:MAG: hypothetical protein GYA21_10550 [Myxococcales bacterium]|nr:hypothetical protein [Myxococcales bacterium]